MRALIEAAEKLAGVLERRSSALLEDAEDLREQVAEAKRKLYPAAKEAHERCSRAYFQLRRGRSQCIFSEFHPGPCRFEDRRRRAWKR